MPQVLANQRAFLDQQPHLAELPDRFDPLWSIELPVWGARALVGWFGDAGVVADGAGLVEVGGTAPESPTLAPWARQPLRGAVLRPSRDTALAVVDDAGQIWRWTPGSAPVAGWPSDRGPVAAAHGLPGRRLLFERKVGGAWEHGVAEPGAAMPRWTRPGAWGHPVLLDDWLVGTRLTDPDHLDCVDLATGELRWTREGRWGWIVGVVGERCWVVRDDDAVAGVDLATGEVAAEVTTAARTLDPSGVIDEAGMLHVCNGLNYDRIDLDAGVLVESVRIAEGRVGPARGAVLGTCGRLVVGARSGPLLVDPRQGTGQTVSEPAQLPCAWGVVRRTLLVFDAAGRLDAYGDETSIGGPLP